MIEHRPFSLGGIRRGCVDVRQHFSVGESGRADHARLGPLHVWNDVEFAPHSDSASGLSRGCFRALSRTKTTWAIARAWSQIPSATEQPDDEPRNGKCAKRRSHRNPAVFQFQNRKAAMELDVSNFWASEFRFLTVQRNLRERHWIANFSAQASIQER